MTTTLLSRHPQIATTRLDEARSEVARRFCPHRLSLTRPRARLDMVHNAAPVSENVTLNYLRYGDEVHIAPGRFEDFFLVQIPLAGRARVTVGDRVVASDTTRGSLGSPTECVDMVWEDGCEQLLVYLRRTAVQQVAGTDVAVVFNPLVDLHNPSIRSWLRLVRLVVDDLEAGGPLLASPLAASHVEQSIIATLLATQPNTTMTDTAPVSVVGTRALRRVLAAVDAEPQHTWRLVDLARLAGLSTRSLQESFQRELGTTPLEHVRRVRLERARQDLLESDPSDTSVTDVASRWGFFHLGRFSHSYRTAFAELPSETLAS